MNPIELLSKMTFIQIHLDSIKEDPKYWESLSNKKQIEIHQVKDELDLLFLGAVQN